MRIATLLGIAVHLYADIERFVNNQFFADFVIFLVVHNIMYFSKN
jgi:hypothetical protein